MSGGGRRWEWLLAVWLIIYAGVANIVARICHQAHNITGKTTYITPTTYLNRESLIRSPDTLNLHVLYCLTVAESLGLEMIFFYLRTEEEYYYSLLRTDADVVQFL